MQRYVLAALMALLGGMPLASAQLQGVGYRFAPAVGYLWFDDNAGLSDGPLYGGAVGLSFGEFVELSGLLMVGSGLETDFSRFGGLEEAPEIEAALQGLPAAAVELQRYGAELSLSLGRTGLAPFLTGGAGVLRLTPDGRPASESIYVSGKAGVQLTSVDRYAVSLHGGVLSYRYNPGSTFFTPETLAEVGLEFGSFNNVQVVNYLAQASVQLYLGGRRAGQLTDIDRAFLDQFGGGLRGLSLQVEPFYSRIRFADELPYRDQTFLGVEAGTDFGPLVGVRGYFARGVQGDDPFAFEPVQLYGGHLRLRLSEGGSIAPFLTAGAGYLDVLDAYEGPGGGLREAEDRFFAQAGLGADISLNPRLRLHAELRGLLLSDQRAGDLSRPEQLYVNPMLRVGASFGLGGQRAARPDAVFRVELDDERRRAALRAAELELDIADAVARGDAALAERLEREQALEREIIALRAQAAGVATDPEAPVRPVAPREPRFMTIPVPEEGEIYIRYGAPGGVEVASGVGPGAAARVEAPAGEEDLRALVREALAEALGLDATPDEPPAAPTAEPETARLERLVEDLLRQELAGDQATLSAAEVQLLERRLADQLFGEVERLRAELRAARTGTPPPVVIAPQPAPAPLVLDETGRPIGVAAPPVARTGIVAVQPLGGLALGAGPNQLVFGVRADYRPDAAVLGLRYYPEVLFGFGGERSVAFNFTGVFPFPVAGPDLLPYAGVGLGFMSYNRGDAATDVFGDPIVDDDAPPGLLLTLNATFGTEYAWNGQRVFVEAMAVNLSRFVRFMAGYRFDF